MNEKKAERENVMIEKEEPVPHFLFFALPLISIHFHDFIKKSPAMVEEGWRRKRKISFHFWCHFQTFFLGSGKRAGRRSIKNGSKVINQSDIIICFESEY